jgi:hypothetical protein
MASCLAGEFAAATGRLASSIKEKKAVKSLVAPNSFRGPRLSTVSDLTPTERMRSSKVTIGLNAAIQADDGPQSLWRNILGGFRNGQ